MINKLSCKLTSFYIRKNKIDESERDIYVYCFEVMLSTLVNIILVLTIGFATRNYIETIIFTITFMAMRGSGGGYHAKTHWCCIISVISIFTAIILLLTFLNMKLIFILGIVFFITGIIVSLLICPVDCENKRIDSNEKKKLKKKLLIFSLIVLVAITILWHFTLTFKVAFTISSTVFSVAMLSLIGFVKNAFLR